GNVTLAATSNAPGAVFTFGTTSASTICTVTGTSVTLVGVGTCALTVTAAAICTVSGTTVTLAGTGTCVLTVTAAAAGNYAAVTTAVTQNLTITAATQ